MPSNCSRCGRAAPGSRTDAFAHTTEDLSSWGNPSPEQVIAHTNLYWSYHSVPDREVGLVTAAELSFA